MYSLSVSLVAFEVFVYLGHTDGKTVERIFFTSSKLVPTVRFEKLLEVEMDRYFFLFLMALLL
jgi:hypothetical protein